MQVERTQQPPATLPAAILEAVQEVVHGMLGTTVDVEQVCVRPVFPSGNCDGVVQCIIQAVLLLSVLF